MIERYSFEGLEEGVAGEELLTDLASNGNKSVFEFGFDSNVVILGRGESLEDLKLENVEPADDVEVFRRFTPGSFILGYPGAHSYGIALPAGEIAISSKEGIHQKLKPAVERSLEEFQRETGIDFNYEVSDTGQIYAENDDEVMRPVSGMAEVFRRGGICYDFILNLKSPDAGLWEDYVEFRENDGQYQSSEKEYVERQQGLIDLAEGDISSDEAAEIFGNKWSESVSELLSEDVGRAELNGRYEKIINSIGGERLEIDNLDPYRNTARGYGYCMVEESDLEGHPPV